MTETSKEYAQALYALAFEEGQEDPYLDALKLVRALFEEHPDYAEFLSSPAIPVRERVEAIEAAFGESVPEYVLAFLCVLCHKGHIRDFQECYEAYEALYQEEHAISIAQVYSVVPLSDAEQEALREKLALQCGHKVQLNCQLDESLLGGVVIHIDGRIIDGSLRNRLHQMKEVITG